MRNISDLDISFDYASYEKMFKLIDNHFGYTNKSLNKLKKELFNQTIDDYYFDIIKKNDRNDLRIVVNKEPLSNEIKRLIDDSYNIFIEEFDDFQDYYNISYDDFINNKVKVNKNEVKLLKAIIDFYYNDKEMFINSNCFYNNYSRREIDRFLDIDRKEITREDIRKPVEKSLSKIIENRLSNKPLYFVISFNYADWFLASTGNSWTSCINLQSRYDCAYWAGLPNSFLDKNRCIIYITDFTEKEYLGVKSYKMLLRFWGMLDKQNVLNITQTYPYRINNIPNIINNYFDKVKSTDDENKSISKHTIKFLYNEKGVAPNIYYDNMTLLSNGRIKYFTNRSAPFVRIKGSKKNIVIDLFSFDKGFKYLVDNNEKITNYSTNLK